MPRRIDIELTSALSDGSWTWRAAGARSPKGTVDGTLLPDGSIVGDELKVEVEQEMEGIAIRSVIQSRAKAGRDLLDFIPDDKPFEEVIETRVKRGRGERSGGRDGGRDGRGRGRGRDGDKRRGRGGEGDGRGRDGDSRGRGRGGDTSGRGGDSQRSDRPKRQHFEAPPEVPQRPKAKRLRPGKARRQEVLASVPEEQRPIAELALQGMAAVRSRVKEENVKLKAADKPEMPEATVLKMAEDMLPKLRVADWLDRAEAAQRQMERLDLRDLRSVVAASADSIVARDETAREIAEQLKVALAAKQKEEMIHWLEDVEAALGVGRVIRALRLSSQPPKAGVMFPPDLARRLGEAATKSLLPEDSGDRWSAVLEAAAFSPVRTLIVPATPPTTVDDDLKKTALRLGPLLPQIAALLGVEVPADTRRPKPLRPTSRKDAKKARENKDGGKPDDRDGRGSRGSRDGGGSRDDRGGRGGRGGNDDREGRGGRGRNEKRPPKDRPKGMRDVSTMPKPGDDTPPESDAEANSDNEATVSTDGIAPDTTASENATPNDTATDVATPDGSLTGDATSDDTASHDTTTTSDDAAVDDASKPAVTASDSTAPADTTLDSTAPGETGETASSSDDGDEKPAAPEDTAPEQASEPAGQGTDDSA